MRREYEMSETELATMLEAMKPTSAMFLSGGMPMHSTPQENANRAWQALASTHGFQWDTVCPVPGKPMRFFTAEPKP